ncbi:helix-turn-helix domain-containing protein [Alicyclobacillus fodiniaquatilis]|uniref:Helix-turn-helix domain-containing protein n=1 Tax=Alicyclobacillus fodiniaquatilis TaxID=1661150 RepID=A0ABW4JHH3_9BACL
MNIAQRIASLRRKHKYTQQTVADHLGISRGAYANYEVGSREPDAETFAKLAELFNVTTDYLLGLDSSNEKEQSSEEQEFAEWLKENMGDDLFFYDFNKSPEEMKEQAIRAFRLAWELEKDRARNRKQK